MAKKQLRYWLSNPKTPKHKTHIMSDDSKQAVCGTPPHWKSIGFKKQGKPLTLAAIDKQFMKAPNPCARCEIFTFNHIK